MKIVKVDEYEDGEDDREKLTMFKCVFQFLREYKLKVSP